MKQFTPLTLSAVILMLSFSASVAADVASADHRQKISDKFWEDNLRKPNFQDRKIIEGEDQNIIEVKAPYTAEDATVVPISIHTRIDQTSERYIRKMHIFVDKNPLPLVGVFEYAPQSGKADLAMRIRVDTFSYVRAVAEMNTGELYMAKRFVRAKGACSALPPASMEDSKRLLGQMKMKVVGDAELGKPSLMQVKVRHPNITGMAPLKIGSHIIPPAFYMNTFEVTYSDKPVIKAQLTFSISMDPALRFYFKPDQEGIIVVKGTDTKNNAFSSSHEVKLPG